MAVSGMNALNLLASRILTARDEGKEMAGLVVVDSNLTCQDFWANFEEIIQSRVPIEGGTLTKIAKIFSSAVSDTAETRSPTKEDVVARIKALVSDKKDLYFPVFKSGSTTEKRLIDHMSLFDTELADGLSWLSSNETFAAIQEVFMRGHFKFLRLDLTEPEPCRALGRALQTNGLTVDTLYLSNVLEYLSDAALPAYRESVRHLLSPRTLVIDTIPRCPCEYRRFNPTQRLRENEGLSVDELFLPNPRHEEPPASYMYISAIVDGRPAYFRVRVAIVTNSSQ